MIFQPWNSGLGDQWATINLVSQVAIEHDRPMFLHSPQHLNSLHGQILDVLQWPFQGNISPVILTDKQATHFLDGYDVWATEYLPTRRRWHRSHQTATVCTQFDGASNWRDKNPSVEQQGEIIGWCLDRGLSCVALGKHMSIAECVNALSTCTLFVGACSGMSHVAHSVGCPTYILEYGQPVVTCHRHKNYVLCKGAGHFIQQAGNWLNYLKFISAKDK